MNTAQIDVKAYSYFADNQWRRAEDNQFFEVHDSGWGRTGPHSLDDFSDVIWINSHSGQRQYPF